MAKTVFSRCIILVMVTKWQRWPCSWSYKQYNYDYNQKEKRLVFHWALTCSKTSGPLTDRISSFMWLYKDQLYNVLYSSLPVPIYSYIICVFAPFVLDHVRPFRTCSLSLQICLFKTWPSSNISKPQPLCQYRHGGRILMRPFTSQLILFANKLHL